MPRKLRTAVSVARTKGSASKLRRKIATLGLTLGNAGELQQLDARQVRRWLSGRVSLGPLELWHALEELERARERKEAA